MRCAFTPHVAGADSTISSPWSRRAWRIVSEDSDVRRSFRLIVRTSQIVIKAWHGEYWRILVSFQQIAKFIYVTTTYGPGGDRYSAAAEGRLLVSSIVTAAVYRGFDQELFALRLTPTTKPSGTGQASDPLHPLTCSQSPVFLVNSRCQRLPATPPSSYGASPLTSVRHTFFRSYGLNLQSSLTRVLSSALGDYLPIHLCRFTVRSTTT